MKKRAVTLLLCLLLVVLSLLRGFAASAAGITPATNADFDVPCAAAILIDEDSGTVLYEKNADARRPIASITKVMTLLLAFEGLEAGKIHLDDFVPVSEHAYHFVNACGLDEAGHLSTARDVALMSREMLLHHTEVRDYCSIWMDTLRGGATQLVNTNKLLKSYRGITGLKTGTTGKAGVCISASAERDGLRLIAVVLGSASGKERFQAASTLLDYGFARYESAAAALPGDAPQTLPVEHGTAATVPLNYESPGHCLMPKGEGSTLKAVVELPASLSAPVAAGEQVGRIKILHQGTEMCSYPITAAQNVDALSFRYCLRLLAQSLLLRN